MKIHEYSHPWPTCLQHLQSIIYIFVYKFIKQWRGHHRSLSYSLLAFETFAKHSCLFSCMFYFHHIAFLLKITPSPPYSCKTSHNKSLWSSKCAVTFPFNTFKCFSMISQKEEEKIFALPLLLITSWIHTCSCRGMQFAMVFFLYVFAVFQSNLQL